MTDTEIIKALECCAADSTKDTCVCCPFGRTANCNQLEGLALDLVNRQQAEIERLKEMVGEVIIPARGGGKTAFLMLRIKAFQAEAIREFAEKLKDQSEWHSCRERSFDYICLDDIDNLVKEMTEDSNE